jgi:tRNA (pseudouridine54-N1)-methyltransferase
MGTLILGDFLNRWFAVIGHRAQSSGVLSLNDLPGSGGRMDVLARAVNSALFLSHAIRENSHVILHLLGGDGPTRRIWFDGSRIRGVRPDERSISGQIKAVIKDPIPPVDRFIEYSEGVYHSGGGLVQTLTEWRSKGVVPVVLDADGEHHSRIPMDSDVGFILSDDRPLSSTEEVSLEGEIRVAIGEKWLQGHSCISVTHYLMDEN